MGAGREGDEAAPGAEEEVATAPEGALEEDAPAEGGSLAAAAEAAFAAADAEAAEAANKLIAAAVGVDEWVIDPRGAAQVENVRYAVGLARDLSLEAPHAAFLAVLADDLLQHAKAGSGEEAAAAMFKRRVAENAAARPARPDTLPAAAVKPVADFFVRGFFAHYKLHAFLFGHERALDQQKVVKLVERAMVPCAPPLGEAIGEEEWSALQAQRAEEAAAAEAAAAARAAEEAEEARLAARTEEEVVMEEQSLKRRPETLEEAVEYEVAKRLQAAREAMDADYAARKQELADKIASLEAKLGGAAGEGGEEEAAAA